MIINRREWLSEAAQEALLYLGKNATECVAFSHPCSFDKGDRLSAPLLALSVRRLFAVGRDAVPRIIRQGEGLAHTVVGELYDVKAGLVRVESLVIEVEDAIPGDIVCGDMVEFSCSRLDVIG